MKKLLLSLPSFFLLACNECSAKTGVVTLEQRMTVLEKRLEAAEIRAENAERKLKDFEIQQAAEIRQIKAESGKIAVNSHTESESKKKKIISPELFFSGYGDLKLYGDVEFNMDAASKPGKLSMISAGLNSESVNERWELNGRILLGFDGIRNFDNGYFAGFSAQPLADMHGSVNVDNALFFWEKRMTGK